MNNDILINGVRVFIRWPKQKFMLALMSPFFGAFIGYDVLTTLQPNISRIHYNKLLKVVVCTMYDKTNMFVQ